MNSTDVLIASQRERFCKDVQSILKNYSPYKLTFINNTDDILTPKEDLTPKLSFIDGQGGTAAASEWVQSVKMTYPDCPVIVLYGPEDVLDFAAIKKNGADYIMHASFDREYISDMALKLAPIEFKGTDIPTSAIMPIDLNDVNSEEPINFDLYIHLPANEKSFRVRKDGGKIDQRLFEKSSETQKHLYIKKTQIKPFFEYARTIVSSRNISNPVPFTERVHKSKQLIYEIMSEFLNADAADFQAGKLIFERCREILSELDLLREKTPEARVAEIIKFTGHSRSTYQDALSMSVFASNFTALLGYDNTKTENAALAGLLHNIGLAKMPSTTIGKTLQEYSPEEKQDYRAYPDRSVNMVKAKKVPLPQSAADAISEHQENINGSGFPKGLVGDKLSDLGKVLRLAFRFLELTSLNDEKPAMTPKAAIAFIKEESLSEKSCVDVVLVNQIFRKLAT